MPVKGVVSAFNPETMEHVGFLVDPDPKPGAYVVRAETLASPSNDAVSRKIGEELLAVHGSEPQPQGLRFEHR